MSRWRGALVAACLIALVTGALLWLAPSLVRPAAERWLSTSLGAPVTIGWLSWNPFAADVSAHQVRFVFGKEDAAVGRVSVALQIRSLLRGELVVEQIGVDQVTAAVDFDEDYRPQPGVHLPESSQAAAMPDLVLSRVVISNADFTLRRQVSGAAQSAMLHVANLTAENFAVTGNGTALGGRVELSGTVNGGAMQAQAEIDVGPTSRKVRTDVIASQLAFGDFLSDVMPDATAQSGSAVAHCVYEWDHASGRNQVTADVRLLQVRLAQPHGAGASAAQADLKGIVVDLAKHRIELAAAELLQPRLELTVTPEGVMLPVTLHERPAGPRAGWEIRLGRVEIKDGKLAVGRNGVAMQIDVPSAHWLDFTPGSTSPLDVRGTVATGGTFEVSGKVGITPLAANLDVVFKDVSLPELIAAGAEVPFAISKGIAAGEGQVVLGDATPSFKGQLSVHDLHAELPKGDRPEGVFAVHSLQAGVEIDLSVPQRVELPWLRLTYPYILVHRSEDSLFPRSLFTHASGQQGAGALSLHLGQIDMVDGRAEFVDHTVAPAFWTAVTNTNISARGVLFPGAAAEQFEMTGLQDEISPIRFSGNYGAQGLESRATVDDLQLDTLNSYAAALLGYKVASGLMSLTTTAQGTPSSLRAKNAVVLRGLELEAVGVDAIQALTGVPLPIALGLIENSDGSIEMDVDLELTATGIDLKPVIQEAVGRAVRGLLAFPITKLGSLFGSQGAPYAFAVQPIPFAEGHGELSKEGGRRLAEIARILQAHPRLLFVAQAQVTDGDAGVVGAARAPELAAQRLAAVREALVGAEADARLPADRFLAAAWDPTVGAKATSRPGVYVELQQK